MLERFVFVVEPLLYANNTKQLRISVRVNHEDCTTTTTFNTDMFPWETEIEYLTRRAVTQLQYSLKEKYEAKHAD
jgi:hypothetical protein